MRLIVLTIAYSQYLHRYRSEYKIDKEYGEHSVHNIALSLFVCFIHLTIVFFKLKKYYRFYAILQKIRKTLA